MQRVVRAFPVIPGHDQAVAQFARELGNRSTEIDGFYKKFGVTRECWFTQHTAHGMLVIAVTDFSGRTPDDAAVDYAAAAGPFDAWFKQQVLKISGVDPSIAPLGPPTSCVFDWPPQPS